MLKTIVFNGGLGNQMFQYAFYLQLKKKYPLDIFLFDIEQSQECHNGFELDRIFHLECQKKVRNYRRIKRHCPCLLDKLRTIKQEHSLEYNKDTIDTHHLLTRYEGFWQSERYFLPIEQDVRESFLFNIELLNNGTRTIAQEIEGKETVSVHIRRGDYLASSDFGVCPIDYYNRAMSFMSEKLNSPTFIFFSDDMEWVKENISCSNVIYVSCNHGANSWQDMYLMSKCKHNIIANSSFSWWGAWLNPNPQKIVITPKRWFLSINNYDIIPDNWIKL